MLIRSGTPYFNPDEAARLIRRATPGASQRDANSAAWHQGRRLLERAIAEGLSLAIETTLGGSTMTAMLEDALARGIEVRVWFAGLTSPELHIARVRARVRGGGHDIPEQDVRRRFDTSRENLIRLLPVLTELRLFDNSREADPKKGRAPEPRLLLHVTGGRVRKNCPLEDVPEWAKPIIGAALTRLRT